MLYVKTVTCQFSLMCIFYEYKLFITYIRIVKHQERDNVVTSRADVQQGMAISNGLKHLGIALCSQICCCMKKSINNNSEFVYSVNCIARYFYFYFIIHVIQTYFLKIGSHSLTSLKTSFCSQPDVRTHSRQ